LILALNAHNEGQNVAFLRLVSETLVSKLISLAQVGLAGDYDDISDRVEDDSDDPIRWGGGEAAQNNYLILVRGIDRTDHRVQAHLQAGCFDLLPL